MTRKLLVLVTAVLLLATGCDNVRIRAQMTKGNKLYRAEKYEAAIGEYKKILAIDSNHYMANYLIAMSNLALYHPGSTHPKDVQYANDAIGAFEKLQTLPAPTPDYAERVQKYFLSLLSAAGRDDKAVALLEKQVQQRPNDPKLMAELANYYAKAGDFPKTLNAFEKAAQLDPQNKTRWYTLGVVCWERSYKGGASVTDAEREQLIAKGEAALDKALGIDPDYFDSLVYQNLLHREMAKVFANRGDLDSAQQEVRKAEALVERAKAAKKKEQLAAQQGK